MEVDTVPRLVTTIDITRALVIYGNSSAENLAALQAAQTAAFTSIKEGNGAQVISGAGNGVNFGLTVQGMTNAEWFTVLTNALSKITSGFNNTSRARARF
jgi:hypothetical protein